MKDRELMMNGRINRSRREHKTITFCLTYDHMKKLQDIRLNGVSRGYSEMGKDPHLVLKPLTSHDGCNVEIESKAVQGKFRYFLFSLRYLSQMEIEIYASSVKISSISLTSCSLLLALSIPPSIYGSSCLNAYIESASTSP